ncbi:MAG TPA: type II secretion system F family protein [Conexibacter sp.]|nr:type II secretion system F family protein [Conexibacter sp.]
MSGAALAFVAAALGVAALWDALVVADALAPALVRLAGPLARLRRDGREPSAPERRRLALVAAAALLAAGWLLGGPLAGAVLAAGGPSALAALLRHRRRRRRAELACAMPTIARAIADALGAGHAIPRALAEAGDGTAGAAGAELRLLAGALALGEPLDAALTRLCERARSRSYDVLAAAILLQRDAGGDLAALLRELASAREEAIRLADDARTATAQARFTGLVVALLPAGGGALAELASPGALSGLLRVPLAAWLAGFALLLQLGALVAIRRLARVTT